MSAVLPKLRVEAEALLRKLTGAKRRARLAADAAFAKALSELSANDLAIDLGANAGDFTERMAQTGADVIAFEPDPHAFSGLLARFEDMPNVRLVNAAAAAQSGRLELYRHVDFARSPDHYSTGSSLLKDKSRMSNQDAVEVEVVDFAAFVEDLGRNVSLLKVDIEGAEVELFECLLASPASRLVGTVFVETHERVLPQLAARTRALKHKTRALAQPQINWDWR